MPETPRVSESLFSQTWYRIALVLLVALPIILIPIFRQTVRVNLISTLGTTFLVTRSDVTKDQVAVANDIVAFGDINKHIQFYKFNGEQIATVDEPIFVHCLKLSSDGRILAAHNKDGGIKLFTAADGKLIKEYPENHCPMALDHDGATLISINEDELTFMRISDDQILNSESIGHSVTNIELEISANGNMVSLISSHSVMLFYAANGQKFYQDDNFVNKIIFSPNGNFIVIRSINEIELYRIHDRKLLKSFNSNYGIRDVAFSADSKKLALTAEHEVIIWDINNGAIWNIVQPTQFEFGPKFLYSPYKSQFSADGKYLLISVSGDDELRRVDSGRLISKIDPAYYLSESAFSSDGKNFITMNTYEGYISFWRIDE